MPIEGVSVDTTQQIPQQVELPESSSAAANRLSPTLDKTHLGNVPSSYASAAPKENKFLHTIGSVNPNWAAGADFAGHLVINGLTDQEQPEAIHFMAPQIPKVSEGGLAATLHGVKQTLETLHAGGTRIAVVTDLMAHQGFDQLAAYADQHLPGMLLIDTTKAAVDAAKASAPRAKSFGLVVSQDVKDAELFQRHDAGKTWVYPTGDTSTLDRAAQDDATPGQIGKARDELREKVRTMALQGGVDAIIVGHPAISSALDFKEVPGPNGRMIPVIDSNKAVAERALELSKAGVDPSDEGVKASCGCFSVVKKMILDCFDNKVAEVRMNREEPARPQVGAMGGMGALAGVGFLRIIGNIKQVPTILHQATHVADRTSFIKRMKNDPSMADAHDPAPEMKKSVDKMFAMGIKNFSLICNTAHNWYQTMTSHIDSKGYDMSIEHIAGAAIDEIKAVPGARHVVLLATDGTVNQRLYQDHEVNHLKWVEPDRPLQDMTMDVIYKGVKVGNMDLAREKLKTVIDTMLAKHKLDRPEEPPIFVLGCTELPLPFTEEELAKNWPGVTFVDPMQAAARRLINTPGSTIAPTEQNVRAVANALWQLPQTGT